jgi:hypothetical protein
MANFELKPISLDNINKGVRYENGDIVEAETINAPIEASAWAQEMARQAFELAQSTESGKVTLAAYPIGSVYISASNISPAELFGGSWLPINDRFLVASGSYFENTKSGGSTTHNHGKGTLQTEIAIASGKIRLNVEQKSWESNWSHTAATGTKETLTNSEIIKMSGETAEANHIPPWVAYNMWERVG